MSLEQIAHYNGLSTKLRDELQERLSSFGSRVRYKFNLERQNPDPSRYNGDVIYPSVYTLDPSIFDIIDPYEEKGKQRSKKIGFVQGADDKGVPNKFKKIKILSTQRGVLDLDLTEGSEDWHTAMFLELHPKLDGGKFQDKNKISVFSRIDERKAADDAKKERTARLKALNAAQDMTNKQVVAFADAMLWDSTVDIIILRNKVEELADASPEFFNDLVSGKSLEYRSTIKQALDRSIVEFEPVEYKFIWSGNKQIIATLSPIGEKSHVEKFADFLQSGGDKADAAYKKIKELLK
jgi:hypothetical protein